MEFQKSKRISCNIRPKKFHLKVSCLFKAISYLEILSRASINYHLLPDQLQKEWYQPWYINQRYQINNPLSFKISLQDKTSSRPSKTQVKRLRLICHHNRSSKFLYSFNRHYSHFQLNNNTSVSMDSSLW